jgi:hypothetical protein
LLGVYHSYRLHILGTCRWYSGTVIAVIHEADGDYHLRVKPASGFSNFLDHDNYTQQYGALVGEIMPGQHLPLPSVGEEISMFGTWVYDADHGWNEIHPIWAIRYFERQNDLLASGSHAGVRVEFTLELWIGRFGQLHPGLLAVPCLAPWSRLRLLRRRRQRTLLHAAGSRLSGYRLGPVWARCRPQRVQMLTDNAWQLRRHDNPRDVNGAILSFMLST